MRARHDEHIFGFGGRPLFPYSSFDISFILISILAMRLCKYVYVRFRFELDTLHKCKLRGCLLKSICTYSQLHICCVHSEQSASLCKHHNDRTMATTTVSKRFTLVAQTETKTNSTDWNARQRKYRKLDKDEEKRRRKKKQKFVGKHLRIKEKKLLLLLLLHAVRMCSTHGKA